MSEPYFGQTQSLRDSPNRLNRPELWMNIGS